MTLPYGVISDPHYHRWDAFATTNADGLNSRLEIQLDATKEAAKAMKAAGCKHMLVAGDTFHVRGAISPSVLHFVTETYEWIIKELGLKVVMLAGNHDLETNDSVYSANAAASLRSIGVEIVCGKRPHSIKMGDVTVHLISWNLSAISKRCVPGWMVTTMMLLYIPQSTKRSPPCPMSASTHRN